MLSCADVKLIMGESEKIAKSMQDGWRDDLSLRRAQRIEADQLCVEMTQMEVASSQENSLGIELRTPQAHTTTQNFRCATVRQAVAEEPPQLYGDHPDFEQMAKLRILHRADFTG